jgi:hypothetical protein
MSNRFDLLKRGRRQPLPVLIDPLSGLFAQRHAHFRVFQRRRQHAISPHDRSDRCAYDPFPPQ